MSFNPHIGPGNTATSVVLENLKVASPAPAQLHNVIVWNSGGASLYLLVFDRATGASLGLATPCVIQPVEPNSTAYADFNGRPMRLGITVALSTTAPAYTDPGAVGWFDITFK